MARWPLFVLCAAALLAVVACGDGYDDDDDAPTDAATATTDAGQTPLPTETTDPSLVATSEVPPDTAPFSLRSEAFVDGGRIPDVHTCSGENSSPPLAWGAVEGAAAYVMLMTDLDARNGAGFDHWAAWNIDASATGLGTGQPAVADGEGITQGLNEAGTVGYIGPCPPPGDGDHRYVFTVVAISSLLDIPAQATYDDVAAAIQGRVLAAAELTGTYSR